MNIIPISSIITTKIFSGRKRYAIPKNIMKLVIEKTIFVCSKYFKVIT